MVLNSGCLVGLLVVVPGHNDLSVVVEGLLDLLVVVISVFLNKSFTSSSSSELVSDRSWQEEGSGWIPFTLLETLLGSNKGFRRKWRSPESSKLINEDSFSSMLVEQTGCGLEIGSYS